jgi:hypothetical protein
VWYARVEPELALFLRDASLVPENGEIMEEQAAQLAALAEGLAQGFSARSAARAAIGHALEFETWRSLVRRQGLSRASAVDAMVRLASRAAAEPKAAGAEGNARGIMRPLEGRSATAPGPPARDHAASPYSSWRFHHW